jgi:MYXO-CTERM domain-containing protein
LESATAEGQRATLLLLLLLLMLFLRRKHTRIHAKLCEVTRWFLQLGKHVEEQACYLYNLPPHL